MNPGPSGFRHDLGVSPSVPDGEAITADGLEVLRADLEELETAGRQAMAERINAARQLGDLKENAEYHIAKDDQAHLETRIQRLRQRLRNAVVVEADASSATVAFGRTAEVVDEESWRVYSWKFVGPSEAELALGKLSSYSPVDE
jgi:transcription elongation factor GreA